MKLSEAYKILELPESSSQDEVKKKYRQMSKKFHPDVNKQPGAEDTFKKINQAYERIKSGEPDQQPFAYHNVYDNSGMGFDLSDLFGFNRQQKKTRIRQEPNIYLSLNISFKESIYGCKKDLSYDRKLSCKKCDGEGSFPDPEKSCKVCNGSGQFVSRKGNTIITQMCNSCHGRSPTLSCNECNASGYLTSSTAVNVSVPPGVVDKNTLKLQGMGNFCGKLSNMFNQSEKVFSDVYLTLNVENDDYFKLCQNDIICNHNISLLDALKGKKDIIRTLDGEQEIQIKPLSKNSDEIILPNKGVGRNGNQRIVLNVQYPDDIQDIVKVLENLHGS